MNFLLLKYIHIVAVASSFALLFIRGIWLLRAYPPAQESWVRVLPHAVDGVLLVSALGMLWVYPAAFKGDWLLVKLLLIFVYVPLTIFVARSAKGAGLRLAAWAVALLLFLLVTSIAVLHNPLGILSLL